MTEREMMTAAEIEQNKKEFNEAVQRAAQAKFIELITALWEIDNATVGEAVKRYFADVSNKKLGKNPYGIYCGHAVRQTEMLIAEAVYMAEREL